MVIVDESHTLKTADRAPDSTNTEAAVAAVKAAQTAVLLTGTPSLSRPFDLYRQVRALLLHSVQARDLRATLLALGFSRLQGFTVFCCNKAVADGMWALLS